MSTRLGRMFNGDFSFHPGQEEGGGRVKISSNGTKMTGGSGQHFNNNLYTTKLVIPPVHQATQQTSQLTPCAGAGEPPLCHLHPRRRHTVDSLVRFSFN